ncbi:PucR family transcriptional regulator [Nonomuraea sp. NPDC050536]|uniref:PucR family transcriptional regulator n=1 Tax=Nonomuraea sp. NPDC050536 TaxID=3364366 RepID=UPI0037C9AFF8
MERISALLESEHLGLRLLAGPERGPSIVAVTAIDALSAIRYAQAGSCVVVSNRLTARALPYQLDVAVRHAAQRGIAGLVLVGATALPITTSMLADRAGLPVLGIPGERDVADVLLQIDRIIRSGAAESLARALEAMAVAAEAEESGDLERLLRDVGAVLTADLRLDGERVTASADDDAVRLVLPAVDAAVTRMRAASLARELAPGQMRSDLLIELVVADRAQASRLAERARILGLPVDGRHIALWIDAHMDDLVERRGLLDAISMRVLRNPRTSAGYWNVAPVEDALLVTCTSTANLADAGLSRAADDLARVLRERHPGRPLHCGVGTAQPGLPGLRTSVAEARAACATAVAKNTAVAHFDATGIQRVLAEVAASPISRKVVDDLLRPLDALGEEQGRQAVATLAAFLDCGRSPRLAATRLNLHFNAVSYRIRKIVTILDSDLDDPDTRFALHLACRLRLTAPW